MGFMQKEKQQSQPAFGGESKKQDFSWRKGGSRLSIKGEARISLAMGISKDSQGWLGLAGEGDEVADTGRTLLERLCVVSPGALCGWSWKGSSRICCQQESSGLDITSLTGEH